MPMLGSDATSLLCSESPGGLGGCQAAQEGSGHLVLPSLALSRPGAGAGGYAWEHSEIAGHRIWAGNPPQIHPPPPEMHPRTTSTPRRRSPPHPLTPTDI